MSFRALLRGSLLYTLGNFLPRIGAFLLLPVYTAAMAPAEFGIFSLMLSLSGLLAIGYRLGLDGALLRFHFDVAEADRPSLYRTSAAVTLAAAIGLSALVALLIGPFFDAIFPGVPFVPYGLLALAITAATAFQYVPSALFRATERPGRFLAFALGVFGLVVAGTLLFVLAMGMGAVGGLLAQLLSGIGVVGATAWILARMRRGKVRPELARGALRFGLPLVPHGLAAWVLNLSDRWLIGLLIGLPAVAAQAAVGVYSFGYVVGQSVALVAMSFNAAWVPIWYARGDESHGPALLREMTSLVMGGLALLAVGVAVLAPELTRVLASARWGAEADAAADVISVVAGASLVYGLYFMVVSTVFLRRRTAGLPLLTLAAGTANVGANLLLIPRLGLMGAAWSTLIGYLALAGLTWWYAARDFPVRLDVVRLALIGGGALTVALLARLVTPDSAGLPASTAFHLGLSAAYAVLLLPLLRGPVARLRALLAVPVEPGPGAGAAPAGG
jgi:O-antigen/teichoic acid export membrane protein